MKKILVLICCGIFCLGAGPNGPDQGVLKKEARLAAKEFMETLKGHLQTAIKKDGPVHAIRVCSQEAPRIASRISRERGWEVGRTSLQLRNHANLPEVWERAILEEFAEKQAQRTKAENLEYAEVVDVNGEKRFRYMKAIPTQEVCLLCHGQELAAEVKEQLAEDYPYDQGAGFVVGDLRGAFSIEVPFLPPAK